MIMFKEGIDYDETVAFNVLFVAMLSILSFIIFAKYLMFEYAIAIAVAVFLGLRIVILFRGSLLSGINSN